MKRKTVYPENHWRMQTDIPYSMGVIQDDLFFLCGQADLNGKGDVQNAGDLRKQTVIAVKHIEDVVRELGCEPQDLCKLIVYYVNQDDVDESDYTDFVMKQLAEDVRPVITMVPLTHFFYPGLMVEIDAYGMRDTKWSRTSFHYNNGRFSRIVKQGNMIFVGAIRSVADDGSDSIQHPGDIVSQSHRILERLDTILAEVGARREDIVKINNWYVGGGTAEDWQESARIRAAYYPEPGPVATGLPSNSLYPTGAMIQTDCWIMLSPEGASLPKQHSWPDNHWDWPIHLPFKHGLKCENMIFTGGQVSMDKHANILEPNDMPKQSVTSMENIKRVLAEFDSGLADVIKVNAFYVGTSDPDDLHTNLDIRSRYFRDLTSEPKLASTGIPLNSLAYEGMLTEFEVIAMTNSR